jgi:hypothetical protein
VWDDTLVLAMGNQDHGQLREVYDWFGDVLTQVTIYGRTAMMIDTTKMED